MYFTKNLKENEELIKLVRRHPLTFMPAGVVSIFFLLLPFFLMFLLFRWPTIGLIIFLFLLAIGLIVLIRLIVTWYYNAFLITNERVVLYRQKGLFNREVSEVEYQKIQDVAYYFKGLGPAFFHYGTLKIQVLSSETVIKVEKIPHPQQIQEIIKTIQKNQVNKQGDFKEEDLVKLATTIKNRLGEEKFKQILKDDV